MREAGPGTFLERQGKLPVPTLPLLPSAPTTLELHELLTHHAGRAKGKEFQFYLFIIPHFSFQLLIQVWDYFSNSDSQRAHSALSFSLPTTQFSTSCSEVQTLTLGNNPAGFGQSFCATSKYI